MPPLDEKPPKIELTPENLVLIHKILEVNSSDSKSADNAYNSLLELAKVPPTE